MFGEMDPMETEIEELMTCRDTIETLVRSKLRPLVMALNKRIIDVEYLYNNRNEVLVRLTYNTGRIKDVDLSGENHSPLYLCKMVLLSI